MNFEMTKLTKLPHVDDNLHEVTIPMSMHPRLVCALRIETKARVAATSVA